MSEESSSTPLRLKPKLKVEGEAPASDAVKTPILPVLSPADAPSATEGAAPLKLKPKMGGGVAIPAPTPAAEPLAAATESRVRLKPKLTVDAEPAAVATTVPVRPAEPAPPPPVLFAEPPSVPAASAPDVVVPPTFKLRPKDAIVESAPVAADLPPPLAVPPLISEPEPSPEVTQAPKPALRVKPSAELIKSFEDPPTVGRSSAKRSRRPVLLAMILLMVVLGGAYFGYSTFVAPGQPAPVPEPVAASPADSGPTSMTGQMVTKAQNVLATRAANSEGTEELGIESRTGSNGVAIAPAEGVMAAMPANRELPPEPEPEASAAFVRFVTEMKISGVFQGVPPRAMINGRTIRAGETVDHGLEIVFTGIDVERRLILLQDASGAKISKKY